MSHIAKKIVIVLAVMLLPFGSNVCRADENKTAQEHFDIGWQSYEQDHYVEALKHLFAFRAMAGPSLDQAQDFKKELDSAIWYAETQVMEAFDTVQQWKKDGTLKQVTVRSSGKADGAGEQASESDKRQRTSRQEFYKPAMRKNVPPTFVVGKHVVTDVPAKMATPMPSKEVALQAESRCGAGLKSCKEKYADLRKRCDILQAKNYKMSEYLRELKKADCSGR